MIKTELRFLHSPDVTINNGSLLHYTNGWTGVNSGYTVTAPSLSDPTGTTTYNAIDSWNWNQQAMQCVGNNPLIQYVDTSTLITDINYLLTFDILQNSVGSITPSLFGLDGTMVSSNGRYTQYFYLTPDYTELTQLTFTPSSGFNGQLSNVSLTVADTKYKRVDLYDDDSFTLTLQFIDIVNRNASFSKTITVPSTANNNILFGNIINDDVYFNYLAVSESAATNSSMFINKKIPAGIYYDDIQMMVGTFELNKITNKDGKYEYEGVFISNSKTFADSVGDKLLVKNDIPKDDLNYSEYNHKFIWQNIVATWTGTTGTTTPWANYPNSKGVYYPMIDWQGKYWDNILDISYLKPALYIKEIIDKIFAGASFTYTSNFLNSNYFKSLILPQTQIFTPDKNDPTNYNYNVGLSSDFYGSGSTPNWTIAGFPNMGNLGSGTTGLHFQNWYDGSKRTTYAGSHTWASQIIPLNYLSPPTKYNNNNVWHTGNTAAEDYFICPANGQYFDFNFSGDVDLYLESYQNPNGSSPINQYPWNSTYNIIRPDNSPSWTGDKGDLQLKVCAQVWKAPYGTTVGGTGNIPVSSVIYNSVPQPTYQAGKSWWYGSGYTIKCDGGCVVNAGDRVYLKVVLVNNNYYATYSGTYGYGESWLNYLYGRLKQYKCSFSNNATVTGVYYEGNTVYPYQILPPDVKQIDFIKSICDMFALVIVEDQQNKNNLIIEPWSQFFNLTSFTTDWSNKIDIMQELWVERLPDLLDKDYLLTYKDDSTDYNINMYKNDTNFNFGSKLVYNPYKSSDRTTVTSIFAPSSIKEFSNSNWLMSQIYSVDDRDSNYDSNTEVWATQTECKIMQRSVLTESQIPVTLSPLQIISHWYLSGSTGYTSTGITSTYSFGHNQTYNYYPYAGFLDNPWTPTNSLEFGKSNFYFQKNPQVCLNNLYWNFHKDKLWTYMNPLTRKVTVYMRLTPSDIALLDFRRIITINNTDRYILYKINEWEPNKWCQVELIKLTVPDNPSYYYSTDAQGNTSSGKTTGGGGAAMNVTKNVVLPANTIQLQSPSTYHSDGVITYNPNVYDSQQAGIIIGNGNNIVGTDNIVQGYNNVINGDKNSTIASNSNTINSDYNTIMNSNYNTINSDGVHLVNSSNNYIQSGLTNVVLFGSTGLTVSSSNTVMINNVGITGSSGTDGTSGSSGTSGTIGNDGSLSGRWLYTTGTTAYADPSSTFFNTNVPVLSGVSRISISRYNYLGIDYQKWCQLMTTARSNSLPVYIQITSNVSNNILAAYSTGAITDQTSYFNIACTSTLANNGSLVNGNTYSITFIIQGTGAAGANGTSGSSGTSGVAGTSGTSGSSGSSGTSGTDGSSGSSGTSGTSPNFSSLSNNYIPVYNGGTLYNSSIMDYPSSYQTYIHCSGLVSSGDQYLILSCSGNSSRLSYSNRAINGGEQETGFIKFSPDGNDSSYSTNITISPCTDTYLYSSGGTIQLGVYANSIVNWKAGSSASAPSTTAAGSVTNRYGGATNFLGNPTGWIDIQVNGVARKLPYY